MTNSAAGLRRSASGDDCAGAGLVIAVDGPSGSGKSSAARGTAARLGLRYLDTGAMYRAVTWWLLEHDIDLADTDAVVRHGRGLTIDISTDPGAQHVRVDGIEVTAEIRNRRVSNVVSLVASVPQIRSYLIALQRGLIADAVAAGAGIVAEGRDIGTVVAPGAAVKVFLTASEQARAERRAAELAATVAPSGAAVPEQPPSAELTKTEQAQRDRRDAPQSLMAGDAVEIDATEIGLDDVVARIVALARAKRAGG
ncbi:MAG TPA: (d)CMP kinase [Streptosporangiaceae bacterium]|nr:(d)CMP kinase [Streptosporangiaceae bacterium]